MHCKSGHASAQDEREERELRKVEMQTQKAENMIEHEAEIYARPPRTWFQTGSLLFSTLSLPYSWCPALMTWQMAASAALSPGMISINCKHPQGFRSRLHMAFCSQLGTGHLPFPFLYFCW